MNAWTALLSRTGAIAAKLEALQPPLLVIKIDSETTLVTVWPTAEDLETHARFPGMPRLTLERKLAEALDKLARLYPSPYREVEIAAQWPGHPPRLERVAVARRSPPPVLTRPLPGKEYQRDPAPDHHPRRRTAAPDREVSHAEPKR